MATLRDLGLFLVRLGHHWGRLLTGGVPVAVLTLCEHLLGQSVPRWSYVTASGFAVLYAAFYVWRDEKQTAGELRRALEDARAADAGLVSRKLTDEEFWLLGLVLKYGLHRKFISGPNEAISDALWLKGIPISFNKSRWLYDLFNASLSTGLLKPEIGLAGVYVVAPHIEKSFAAERRLERTAVQPAQQVFDVTTGEPIDLGT